MQNSSIRFFISMILCLVPGFTITVSAQVPLQTHQTVVSAGMGVESAGEGWWLKPHRLLQKILE